MMRMTIQVPIVLVALVIALALIGGLGAEPAPVTAAPFSCRLVKTFQMPTLEELVELYGDDEIPGGSSFLAGLDSRCLRNLVDRKSTRLNSSHSQQSRMPSSA